MGVCESVNKADQISNHNKTKENKITDNNSNDRILDNYDKEKETLRQENNNLKLENERLNNLLSEKEIKNLIIENEDLKEKNKILNILLSQRESEKIINIIIMIILNLKIML